MSQSEVKLYDDSVIRLTVKQGAEKERFPVTIGSGQIFENEKELTDFGKINSVSGALVSGELGYTRDSHRLFVGNISSELNGLQQQTLGGTLVGNKYLGFIDSRDGNNLSNPSPLKLSELLNSDSDYRSYNFEDNDDDALVLTEDRKWQRMSYYNETYDAYDGDYMYDAYRNAIILFDHNIKSVNNPEIDSNGKLVEKMRGKRKTIFESRFNNNVLDEAKETVYEHTKDMYGDGYVLFYNVIPDGDTLTFANKSFDSKGKDNNEGEENNYSYNIIKLNRVPSSALEKVLNPNDFTFSGGVISLKVKSGSNGTSDSLLNDLANAENNSLVKINKDENDNVTLVASNIIEENLSWINTNLNEDSYIKTIRDKILKPENDEGGHYITKREVETLLSGSSGSSSSLTSNKLEYPFPDFTHSYNVLEHFPNSDTIDVANLKIWLSYPSDEEVKTTTHFLLLGGTGEITLTHSYNGEIEESSNYEKLEGTTTFGKTSSYFETLIPFKLNQENEKLKLGNTSNISKMIIIPEK